MPNNKPKHPVIKEPIKLKEQTTASKKVMVMISVLEKGNSSPPISKPDTLEDVDNRCFSEKYTTGFSNNIEQH